MSSKPDEVHTFGMKHFAFWSWLSAGWRWHQWQQIPGRVVLAVWMQRGSTDVQVSPEESWWYGLSWSLVAIPPPCCLTRRDGVHLNWSIKNFWLSIKNMIYQNAFEWTYRGNHSGNDKT